MIQIKMVKYTLAYFDNRWGVFTETTAPRDFSSFQPHCYRTYEVTPENATTLWIRLNQQRANLDTNNVVPTPENHGKLFPSLEKVIATNKRTI
jgi:hypothetical protein